MEGSFQRTDRKIYKNNRREILEKKEIIKVDKVLDATKKKLKMGKTPKKVNITPKMRKYIGEESTRKFTNE